jgi:hypothetical protein
MKALKWYSTAKRALKSSTRSHILLLRGHRKPLMQTGTLVLYIIVNLEPNNNKKIHSVGNLKYYLLAIVWTTF